MKRGITAIDVPAKHLSIGRDPDVKTGIRNRTDAAGSSFHSGKWQLE